MSGLRLWSIVVAVCLLVGCGTESVSYSPGADLSTAKTFYVQKLPADQRGIEKLFARQLNEWGYQATTGVEAKPAAPVDAIVTYQDRWLWLSYRMFMSRLNVEIRDGRTGALLASAEQPGSTAENVSPEGMVKAILQAALKRPN
jgi:hypothetical protein